MKTIVLLSILLINLNMFGMDEPCLPNDVKQTLDEHASELQVLLKKFNKYPDVRMGENVRSFEWLPNWFIKFGIERVANRNKLHDVIQKYNLNLLSVAEKYLYRVPGTPIAISNESYLVIAKEVHGLGGRGQQINVDQAKQLWKLALKAPHYDLHRLNYKTIENGMLVIIDTDKQAMPDSEEAAQLQADWIEHGTRIHDKSGGVPKRGKLIKRPMIINDPSMRLEFILYSEDKSYDEEAYEYIYTKCKKREEHRLSLKQEKGKKQETSI